MSELVIQIENLTKTYRSGLRRSQVFAVRNLNLSVKKGSIVAFVGPNGAGKTTTIHSLLGFLKPDNGTIRLFGEPTGSASLRRRVGYQCEIFHTYPFYTGTQALTYYGRLAGVSKEVLARTVPLQLERMGLTSAANRKSSGFSKGMTQRLGLAQALLHEPELLILDEPTSGLDPEGRRLVLEIIREEKAKGKTIFLSSHILADVERTCDEVVMVRQGQVAFSDHVSAFSNDSQEWEIEVTGFNNSILEVLGSKCSVVSVSGEDAVLMCTTEDKREVLKTMLSLPLEIGGMKRRRTGSLEDAYMKHVGRA